MHAIPSQREACPVHVIHFEYAHIITVADRIRPETAWMWQAGIIWSLSSQ